MQSYLMIKPGGVVPYGVGAKYYESSRRVTLGLGLEIKDLTLNIIIKGIALRPWAVITLKAKY